MKSIVSRHAGRLFARPGSIETSFFAPRQPYRTAKRLPRCGFCSTRSLQVVKPYLLADIGEGITECQVIQWFVKPGARVEQFDPICEVQSDKASVEITSRFDGVIKKLYYEPDDMAKVGKPLVDIDIQSEIAEEDEALLNGAPDASAGSNIASSISEERIEESASSGLEPEEIHVAKTRTEVLGSQTVPSIRSLPSQALGRHSTLATPAVRHRIKELNLAIEDIAGTGKDGRITKEDVQNHAAKPKTSSPLPSDTDPLSIQNGKDSILQLTPIQAAMYKQMTRSLSIPHFLYTDNVDFTALNILRQKYNTQQKHSLRITTLPFIIKAVSVALQKYPLLNAHLNTDTERPQLLVKGNHDFGIAVDTPSGLLVPVIRHVQSLSVESLAAELLRLGALGRAGKLTSADLGGATFTISNIGSIGGTAVAPVIVGPQVGILGVGRCRTVPAFDEDGRVVRRDECVFSWSADHRVIDGAMAARCAEVVRGYLEDVESMLVSLR